MNSVKIEQSNELTMKDGLQRGNLEALTHYFENPTLGDAPLDIPLLLAAAQQLQMILFDDSPFTMFQLHDLRSRLAGVPLFIGKEEDMVSAIEVIPDLISKIRETIKQDLDVRTKLAALLFGALEICRAIRITDEELNLCKNDPEKRLHYGNAAVFHYWVGTHDEVTYDYLLELLRSAPKGGRLTANLYRWVE